MGTTLTGTTPQDTYDSLIKVTDNGPLSGTAKYLSDGLGNDSLLAVSTASGVGVGTTNVSTYDAAKIGTSHRFLNIQSGSGAYAVGTLAGNQSTADSRIGYLTFVNENNSSSYKYAAWLGSEVEGATANQQGGRLIFATSQNASSAGPIERMRITSAGNVGIGTSSPIARLDVVAPSSAVSLSLRSRSANDFSIVEFRDNTGAEVLADFYSQRTGAGSGQLIFTTYNSAVGAEMMRLTPDKYLRLASGTGGIQFNGDTAAANALDDYEEGTFTPTTSSDPTGAFSGTTGEYTKIGNVVHFRIVVAISSNFADNFVGGLPFTVGGSSSVSAFSGAFNVANENFPDIIATTIAGQSYIRFYTNNDTNNQAQPATTWGTLRIFGSYRV